MLANEDKKGAAATTEKATSVGGLQLSRSQIVEQLELLRSQRSEIESAIAELEASPRSPEGLISAADHSGRKRHAAPGTTQAGNGIRRLPGHDRAESNSVAIYRKPWHRRGFLCFSPAVRCRENDKLAA